MVIPNAPNWVKELNHCTIAVEIIIVDFRFDTVEISLGKEYSFNCCLGNDCFVCWALSLVV